LIVGVARSLRPHSSRNGHRFRNQPESGTRPRQSHASSFPWPWRYSPLLRLRGTCDLIRNTMPGNRTPSRWDYQHRKSMFATSMRLRGEDSGTKMSGPLFIDRRAVIAIGSVATAFASYLVYHVFS
jgi:hypothetical protein